MAGIALGTVMNAMAAALEASGTVTKAHAWPVEGMVPGQAVIGYPRDPVELDHTYQRGSDRLTIPVWFLCGLPQDKSTRTAVSDLLTAAGTDVGDALNADLGGASIHVMRATVETVEFQGGPPLLAVRFDCDAIST